MLGRLKCWLGLHKWGPWCVWEKGAATGLPIRVCKRCGRVEMDLDWSITDGLERPKEGV